MKRFFFFPVTEPDPAGPAAPTPGAHPRPSSSPLPLQVACETATKTDMIMVFGEITTKAKVDYEAVVRCV